MSYDWSKYAPQEWRGEVAPCALPILIRRAKAGLTITYTELARELEEEFGLPPKQRKTLYGQPVGAIGLALEDLAKAWGTTIPPLNAIVVAQDTGLPGDGADSFVRRFLSIRGALKKHERRDVMEQVWLKVWHYTDWDRVAASFGSSALDDLETNVEPIKLPGPREGGRPESPEHDALKNWVCSNPKFLAKFGTFPKGTPEKVIDSGDRLDAFFDNGRDRLAVEVKASHASDAELIRGVFQCVKYRAVLRAAQLAQGELPNAGAVLVTTRAPDTTTKRLLARLSVVLLRAPTDAERRKLRSL